MPEAVDFRVRATTWPEKRPLSWGNVLKGCGFGSWELPGWLARDWWGAGMSSVPSACAKNLPQSNQSQCLCPLSRFWWCLNVTFG